MRGFVQPLLLYATGYAALCKMISLTLADRCIAMHGLKLCILLLLQLKCFVSVSIISAVRAGFVVMTLCRVFIDTSCQLFSMASSFKYDKIRSREALYIRQAARG